jgi:splicing factor 3B subunit 3
LVIHTVGVDVGFENPIFACLEVDYSEADSDPDAGLASIEKVKTFLFESKDRLK